MDQCVLNSFLDGSYVEIPEQLNFTSRLYDKEFLLDEVVFYHFVGSRKPWTVKEYSQMVNHCINIFIKDFLIIITTLFTGIKGFNFSIF